MEPVYENTTVITRDKWYRTHRAMHRLFGKDGRRYWLILGCVAVALSFYFLIAQKRIDMQAMMMAFGCFCIWRSVYGYIIEAWRSFRALGKDCPTRTMKRAFFDDHLAVGYETLAREHPYDSVDLVIDTDGLLLVASTKLGYQVTVDMEGFEKGDAAGFVAFLRDKCPGAKFVEAAAK